jgi:phytoene/squalene synthetase
MSAAGASAQDHFVAKWHAREPEMALAEVFCPPDQRPRFRAWGALLHELREAAFELSDPRVTATKLSWWAEELLLLGGGKGRHPLAPALAAPGLPWAALAAALLAAVDESGRPGDPAQALAQLRPLAAAIAAVEARLFAPAADAADATPALVDAVIDSVAVNLLLQRLPQGLASEDQARLPMNLLARHGLTAAQVAAGQGEALLRDWAAALLAAQPARLRGAPLWRRLRHGYDRVRLQRLAGGRGFAPSAPALSVWRGWRIARSP